MLEDRHYMIIQSHIINCFQMSSNMIQKKSTCHGSGVEGCKIQEVVGICLMCVLTARDLHITRVDDVIT